MAHSAKPLLNNSMQASLARPGAKTSSDHNNPPSAPKIAVELSGLEVLKATITG
jgi:hypothetical protein